MSDIIIFDVDESPTVEEITSKDERTVFYEGLRRSLPQLAYHIDTLFDMEKLENVMEFSDSTIDTILAEQLLPFVFPLLTELPGVDYRAKNVMLKTSDANIRQKDLKARELLSNRNILKIQLLRPQTCIYKNRFVQMPKNITITINGFVIDKKMSPYATSPPSHEYLANGTYTIFDFPTKQYHTFYSSVAPELPSKLIDTLEHNVDFSEKYYAIKLEDKTVPRMIREAKSLRDVYVRSQDQLYQFMYHYLPKHTDVIAKSKPITNLKETKLDQVVGRSFQHPFYLQVITDIANAGYFNEFHKFDRKSGKSVRDQLNFQMQVLESGKKQMFEKFRRMMQLYLKKNIALKKFGTENLFRLKPGELVIVEKEYNAAAKKRVIPEEELEKVMALYRAIDNDEPENIAAALKTVKSLLKPDSSKTKNNELLKTKKDIELICPHIITKAEHMLKTFTNVVERSTMIRNTLIDTYSVFDHQSDGYYCKICGEELANNYDVNDITLNTSAEYAVGKDIDNYDTLYTIIYRETVYIVTTFVLFKNVSMDASAMIKNITKLIKPEIHTLESNLLKVKTATKENVATTLNIYIYMYVFAALVQLLYTNSKLMSFKPVFKRTEASPSSVGGSIWENDASLDQDPQDIWDYVDGGAAKEKQTANPAKENQAPVVEAVKEKLVKSNENQTDLRTIINEALFMLKRVKGQDIYKSTFITYEGIKDLFIKIYRWVISQKYVGVTSAAKNFHIQQDILQYFIYAYNHDAATKKPIPNFYYSDLPAILMDKNKTWLGQLTPLLGRPYDLVQKELSTRDMPIGNVYGMFSKTPEIKIATDIDARYIDGSFQMVAEYTKKNMFLKLVDDPELLAFYKKYEYLNDLYRERKHRFIRKMHRPFMNLRRSSFILNTDIDQKLLCRCKSPQYIFQKKNSSGSFVGEKKEFDIGEINDWLQNNKKDKLDSFNSWYLVERRCKDCDKPDTTSDQSIEIFYKKYETACPNGDLHDFVGDKCKKCGITIKLIEARDKTFFNKFKSVFEKTRKTFDAVVQPTKPTKKSLNPVLKFPKWEFKRTDIMEFVKRYKLNENEVSNIGFYEKNKQKDIKTGAINLANFTHGELVRRNNALYGHYMSVIRTYNIVRTSETLAVPPAYLKDLFQKHPTKDLSKLPVLNQSFLDQYKYYTKTTEPKLLGNFLLHSICNLILQIHKTLDKNKQTQLATELTGIIIKQIFDAEKKLLHFVVLKCEKKTNDAIEVGDITTNKEDDFDDIATKDELRNELEYTEEDAMKDEEEDIFSMENVDVEMDENGEDDNLQMDFADK